MKMIKRLQIIAGVLTLIGMIYLAGIFGGLERDLITNAQFMKMSIVPGLLLLVGGGINYVCDLYE